MAEAETTPDMRKELNKVRQQLLRDHLKAIKEEAAKAEAEWQRIVDGARLARSAGLEVHAGHGLDYVTAEQIAGLPEIVELNIGYYMIGEALFVGLAGTVRAMRAAMDRGRSVLASRNLPGQNPVGKT